MASADDILETWIYAQKSLRLRFFMKTVNICPFNGRFDETDNFCNQNWVLRKDAKLSYFCTVLVKMIFAKCAGVADGLVPIDVCIFSKLDIIKKWEYVVWIIWKSIWLIRNLLVWWPVTFEWHPKQCKGNAKLQHLTAMRSPFCRVGGFIKAASWIWDGFFVHLII